MPATEWFESAGPAAAERYRAAVARYARLGSFDERAAPAPLGRVSVLVPSLDEALYVEDAVRSLAEQTLRRDHPAKVEIVLVDSGSKDATRDLARPYVDRTLSSPRGKLTALVDGVRKASGDLIV